MPRIPQFDSFEEFPPATEPSNHPAGSRERIDAYADRFLRGEAIFHDDDAKTIVRPSSNNPKPTESAIREFNLRKLFA